MQCPVCGEKAAEGSAVCVGCGSPLNSNAAVISAQPVSSQELSALGQAMYDYCRVDLVPKSCRGRVLAFALIGALLVVTGAVTGLWPVILIGLPVGIVGVISSWCAGGDAVKNSQRLKSLFANDGEEFVLKEFASAKPFAGDQFRISGFYLFVRGKGVFRNVSIEKLTRVTESFNYIPTGVKLDALITDESGTMYFSVCKLHLGRSRKEADELYNEISARKQFACEHYSQNR